MNYKVTSQNILHNGHIYTVGEEFEVDDETELVLSNCIKCQSDCNQYSKLKRDELVLLACDLGLEVKERATRAEIISIITQTVGE